MPSFEPSSCLVASNLPGLIKDSDCIQLNLGIGVHMDLVFILILIH